MGFHISFSKHIEQLNWLNWYWTHRVCIAWIAHEFRLQVLRKLGCIVQRRCRILEIVLTTCWVHTTLARYGCEYPCLLRKIYAWGFIYHIQNISNNWTDWTELIGFALHELRMSFGFKCSESLGATKRPASTGAERLPHCNGLVDAGLVGMLFRFQKLGLGRLDLWRRKLERFSARITRNVGGPWLCTLEYYLATNAGNNATTNEIVQLA